MAVPPTLQYYSCCIELYWYSGIFCVSILILGFFFPVSKTNVLGMLIWIALNQKPSFGGMLIFMILILAIHGNWCLSIF